MKNTLTLLFVVISLPVLSLSETPQTPGTPTWAEASAQIEAKMLERQARETARKAAIEAVSAFEEWEVDHGNRKTILRRVAPPIPLMGEEPKISSPAGDAWTEEEFTAWIAAQPVPRTLNLSTVVYDHSFTKITWREEETGEEWTVLSNIDFRYLSGIGSFEDENHHWQTFLFVDEVDSEKETQTAR
ncbi:MAG: hypothetical protein LAT58_09360, partial [Opitutales bacterium]|nr:hypothetical protein [Opitutales bacterium]